MSRNRKKPKVKSWLSNFVETYGLFKCAIVVVVLMVTAAATLRLILDVGDYSEFHVNSDLNIFNYFVWKLECSGKPKSL